MGNSAVAAVVVVGALILLPLIWAICQFLTTHATMWIHGKIFFQHLYQFVQQIGRAGSRDALDVERSPKPNIELNRQVAANHARRRSPSTRHRSRDVENRAAAEGPPADQRSVCDRCEPLFAPTPIRHR